MIKTDLSFTTEEFRERLKQTRTLMAGKGLDLLVLDEIEAMSWVTGYAVSETLWRACAIPLEGEPFLMVRSLDVAPARERSWLSDIIGFRDWEDPLQTFAEAIRERGYKRDRIGLDLGSHSMPVSRFQRFRALFEGSEILDFGKSIWVLRLKKSPAELDYIRRAARVADLAMEAAVAAVRPGGVQREVVTAAAVAYLNHGADDALVGPLTTGSDWDSLHGHEHVGTLQPGTIVHIELVPRVRDYSARIMRSAIVGTPTAEQHETAAKLIEIQDRQIAALRPGALARDVDAIMRDGVLKERLRPSYDNITGYTLGAYPYPTPHISDFSRIFTPAADWIIEAGMVVHMYTSARGLAFSETIHVTESGPERMLRTERKLFWTDVRA